MQFPTPYTAKAMQRQEPILLQSCTASNPSKAGMERNRQHPVPAYDRCARFNPLWNSQMIAEGGALIASLSGKGQKIGKDGPAA
jgi:hypothetical protein